MANDIKAVLFDLDGTLLDTAADFSTAINLLLAQHNKPPLAHEVLRTKISTGIAGMLKTAFQLTDQDAQLTVLKANLFELYRQHLAEQTQPFAGINELLITLEQNNLAWGIVTNKPSYLTQQLLSQLNFGQQAGAIVCADQVANPKPDPEALLVACEKMAITPQQAIYIGDHQRDIKAGNAAGMFTIAACYGYLEDHHQPEQWQADYLVDSVLQLRQLIDQLTMPCESAV